MQKGHYNLSDKAILKLEERLLLAISACRRPITAVESLISDIYSGRDHTSSMESFIPAQGISLKQWVDHTSTSTDWRAPQTMANLLQTRARQIITALNPGVPTIHCKPRNVGAAKYAEAQNKLYNFLMQHAKMEQCMRKFVQSALFNPYAAIRVWFDYEKSTPDYERVRVETIEGRDCGWEPFYRRFKYHRYRTQIGDLPKSLRDRFWTEMEYNQLNKEDQPEDYDIVEVVEVYHENFLGGHRRLTEEVQKNRTCPYSCWVRSLDETYEPTHESEIQLGKYCGTKVAPVCPIIMGNFLEPATNEDIPPAEVISWLPPLRGIVNTLIQIGREANTVNKVILYDDSIEPEHIDAIMEAIPSATLYIPIATDENGVAQKMRPMEKSNHIPELMQAFGVYMSMLDEITGVTATSMGRAENPRKSATEAGALAASSNQRNEDRLKVMSRVWQDVAQVIHHNQRKLFGKSVSIVSDNGVVNEILVPSPQMADFQFRVDPVELGHMSKQNEADQLLSWVTIFSNAFLQFQGSMPRIIRESLRRVALLMGIENVDAYLDAPVIEEGPEDRYVNLLENGGELMVQETDDHNLHIGYYTAILDRAIGSGNAMSVPVAALRDAIVKHQDFMAKAQQGMQQPGGGGIVPGMGPEGQPSADTAAMMQSGAMGPGGAGGSLFPIDKTPLLGGGGGLV